MLNKDLISHSDGGARLVWMQGPWRGFAVGCCASHPPAVLLDDDSVESLEPFYRSGDMADVALDHQGCHPSCCCIPKPSNQAGEASAGLDSPRSALVLLM